MSVYLESRVRELEYRLGELMRLVQQLRDKADTVYQMAVQTGGGNEGAAPVLAVSPATAPTGGIPPGGSAQVTLPGGIIVVANNTFTTAAGAGASPALMVGQDNAGAYWVLSEDC